MIGAGFCGPACPLGAQTPEVNLTAKGAAQVRWDGTGLSGPRGFEVLRVVLEGPAEDGEGVWGKAYTAAPLEPPQVHVEEASARVVHRYPWGEASLSLRPGPEQLTAELVLRNTTPDQTIADFRVRLLELETDQAAPGYGQERVEQTLDRPYWHVIPHGDGRWLATYETFDEPLQFGFQPAPSNRDNRARSIYHYALVAMGGVPAMRPDLPVMPALGRPSIGPGQSRTFTFVLRRAAPNRSDATVLQPYFRAYRAAQQPGRPWPDRRPIGKLTLPSMARHANLGNPRGWFSDPKLDIRRPEGEARFRERLMALADQAIEHARSAGAQGVIVWNLEGSHVPPAQPMGDPRLLEAIAPEMDAHADAFFERFTEAGLRTGLTIRPSQLYMSQTLQRWTQGSGALGPEPDPFAEALDLPDWPDERRDRLYPLVERLSDKIAYAQRRWGCSLFYIHFNGAWHRPAPGLLEDWMLFDGRVLQKLRAKHPDVLLIPQYAYRHWRSARASQVQQYQQDRPNQTLQALAERDDVDIPLPSSSERLSWRGTGADRLGGTPTPEWVIANVFRLRRNPAIKVSHMVPGPEHVLRESYWASSAPLVELRQERLIREYLMTLEQHGEYTEKQAQALAEAQIAFEDTPQPVRDWMPAAFSTIDLMGAELNQRRSQLERAAAWGDVLMWPADQSPGQVKAIERSAVAYQQRLEGLGRRVGLIGAKPAEFPLPMSMIWARGEALAAESILGRGQDPAGLRVRVAYGPEGDRAVLMIAGHDQAGRILRLNPQLPGVNVSGAHKHVWIMPGATRPASGSSIELRVDGVTGLTTLLVEGSDDPPPAPPPGVALAAPFDEHGQPQFGGGPGDASAPADIELTDGRDGRAALIGPDQPIRYHLVPDWFAGSIEFDLQARSLGEQPTPVLRLAHHLDATLTLERRDGQAGLALRVGEQQPEAIASPEHTPSWSTFVPLDEPRRWRHVVLSWQLGQYHLYVDGRSAAKIIGPAAIRSRDGTVLEPGLMLGGEAGEGEGRAAIDSLVFYDWAMSGELAAERAARRGMSPASRPPHKGLRVWVFGELPRHPFVTVNLQPRPDWSGVGVCEVQLYEKLEMGRRRLAKARLGVYDGVVQGPLIYKPAKKADYEGNAEPKIDLDDIGGGGGDDIAGLLDEMDLRERVYILEIIGDPASAEPLRHQIQFTVEDEQKRAWHWPAP